MGIKRLYKSVFMIFLISTGCKNDLKNPFELNTESENFKIYEEDYDSPKYKWGYIDLSGKLVIENLYDECREFKEGLAAINHDGLWGYIDRTGKTIIEPRFRFAYEFSEGLALVMTFDDNFLFYNSGGQVTIDTLDFQEVQSFNSGLARVYNGQHYGFIDQEGNIALECNYIKASNFENGIALVYEQSIPKLIKTDGSLVIDTNADKLYHPKDDMIRFKTGNKFGYKSQNKLYKKISPIYLRATDFHNGKAVVYDGSKYHLIDRIHKKAALPYQRVLEGGDNYWIYKSGSKYGYLKNDGQILTLPNYTMATRFRDGMAAVQIGESWGYIDTTGNIKINPQLPLVWDFIDSRARIIDQNGFGFIDKNGNVIIPPQHMEVRDYSEGLARVQIRN